MSQQLQYSSSEYGDDDDINDDISDNHDENDNESSYSSSDGSGEYDFDIPETPSYLSTLLDIDQTIDDDENENDDGDEDYNLDHFEFKTRRRLNSSCKYAPMRQRASPSNSSVGSNNLNRPPLPKMQNKPIQDLSNLLSRPALIRKNASRGNSSFQTQTRSTLSSNNSMNPEDEMELKSIIQHSKSMQDFLQHHNHTMNHHQSAPNRIITATGNGMDPEDYIRYLSVSAASPDACRELLEFALRTDDVSLVDTLLRDVGIEFILRHCDKLSCPELEELEEEETEEEMMDEDYGYDYEEEDAMLGLVEEEDEDRDGIVMDDSSTIATESLFGDNSSHGMMRDGSNHGGSQHGNTPQRQPKQRKRQQTQQQSSQRGEQQRRNRHKKKDHRANIFWMASFFGSANVLDVLAQDTLAFILEQDKQNHHHHEDNYDHDDHKEDMHDTTQQTTPLSVEVYYNHQQINRLDRAKKTLVAFLDRPMSKLKNTPMYTAAEQNHADVISILLKHGADPNITNARGNTPALIAASLNRVDALRVLLESGNSSSLGLGLGGSNSRSGAGTILHRSSSDGTGSVGSSSSVSKADLSVGIMVDFDKMNKLGMNPVLAASQCGNLEALKVMYEYCHPSNNVKEQSQSEQEKNSPTHLVNMMHMDTARPKLDLKVRDADGFGCTALAARYNRIRVIEYFCQIHGKGNSKYSLNVNQRDVRERETALHIAARCNNHEVVRCLLEGGSSSISSGGVNSNEFCNPTLKNKQEMTALHIAARYDFPKVVKEFINALSFDRFAELDTKDMSGRTPLYYAASSGNLEVVKLLAPVSDLSIVCRVHYKERKGDQYSSKVFKHQPAVVAAAAAGHCDVLTTLLHCGSQVNGMDGFGHTAVSLAARYGHLEAVKLLVENGANLKARSKKGSRTPLQKAKKYKHMDVVAYLEANGGR